MNSSDGQDRSTTCSHSETLLFLHPLKHKRSWIPTISRKSLEEVCPMFSFPHPDTSRLLTFCWQELGLLTTSGLGNVVQLRGLESENACCAVISDSLWSHGLWPTRLLCPWNSPGKNTEVGCHALLQRIFPTQGWNLGLLHCRQILYHLTHQSQKA